MTLLWRISYLPLFTIALNLDSLLIIVQEGLISLLPRVVDLVSDCDIPVIAAGGIVDGRGYVAALALGAHGVCLGTRYAASLSIFT